MFFDTTEARTAPFPKNIVPKLWGQIDRLLDLVSLGESTIDNHLFDEP